MLNTCVLIGRLVRDPELKYLPNGTAVTTFTIAVDRPFTDSKTKERETDFLPIVVWRQPAETCANYLRKGRLCAVTGRIQVRSYENNEGRKIFVTEIIADNVRFLESPNSQNNASNERGNTNTPSGNKNGSGGHSGGHSEPFAGEGPLDIDDSSLPF